jgi:hypothetical protein
MKVSLAGLEQMLLSGNRFMALETLFIGIFVFGMALRIRLFLVQAVALQTIAMLF